MVYKVFFFEDLVSDQNLTINVSNEYAVTKMAMKKELEHVAPLQKALIGINHIALCLPRYEMNFRDYLENHRDVRNLTRLF